MKRWERNRKLTIEIDPNNLDEFTPQTREVLLRIAGEQEAARSVPPTKLDLTGHVVHDMKRDQELAAAQRTQQSSAGGIHLTSPLDGPDPLKPRQRRGFGDAQASQSNQEQP